MKIKNLPFSERPREKALKYGLSTLSNSELIAILIQTGMEGKSSIDLGYEVLNKANGLVGLINSNVKELSTIKGISKAKAIQILTAVEMAKRLNDSKEVGQKIVNGTDIYNLVGDYLKNEEQENFVLVLLDIKSNLICYKTLYKGGLNSNLIHMRDIFREIVRYNAYKFICVHNHPSGDPHPSQNDILTTKEIIKIAKIMGVRFEDHIIIGDNCYFSFKENE